MAKVLFKRIEDSALIDNYPIVDGSVFVTKDGKMFIDYDNTRAPVGGTPDTQMSDRSTNSVQNKIVKAYIDDKIQEVLDIQDTYSTSEIKTDKLWVNDKPIYRKVILTNGTMGTNLQISHNISNFEYGISYNMVSISVDSPYTTYFNNDQQTVTILRPIRVDSTYLYADIGAGFDSNWNIYHIIEYTKTTD